MKITLVPSSPHKSADLATQYLTSFLFNDVLALDVGGLGFSLPIAEQVLVKHIVLSHTHIDHLASLPLFLDTVVGQHPDPVRLYASQNVLDCLRTDLFNDRLWPNFLDLSFEGRPFVVLQPLTAP